ncbi:MAG: protein kinase [Deltaproteobacteria bacterium]|nr:protein kinase [Deltaproteobacteria bacterium]
MSEPALRVLVLEDDAATAHELLTLLKRSRRPPILAVHACASADSLPDPSEAAFDAVLLGVERGDLHRLAILDEVLRRAGGTPVVAIVSGNDLELGDRLIGRGVGAWVAAPGLAAGALRRAIQKAVAGTPKDRVLTGYVAALDSRRPSPSEGSPSHAAWDRVLACLGRPEHDARVDETPVEATGSEAPAAPAERSREARGEVLDGKYELLRTVAEGGLGQVFEARHVQIGHRVAVKMIRRPLSGDAELAARFLLEARAAGAVAHPGCIKIMDFGMSPDGRVYLVMEYLEGENLAQRIRRETRLPVPEAVAVVSDTLDVLAATHAKGIVHRDLKPENIFLASRPHRPPEVKLLDFGIARLSDRRAGEERLTDPGVALGSPHFMAPEQIAALPDVDARADTYATGVVLFEALTGRTPFQGANSREVMLHALTEPFPSLRSVDPSLPDALDQVVRRATARDRAHRFPSAEAFQLALQPFGGGA